MFNELDYSPERTVFMLVAPTDADRVLVRIYSSVEATTADRTAELAVVGTDRWMGRVDGDWLGRFYTFEVYMSADAAPVVRGRTHRVYGLGETPGLSATAVGVNGRRAAIINRSSTDPEGWTEDVRPPIDSPADLMVYEVHLRDFSIHPQSGYEHKGKYLTLAEPKAIYYLKTLGVNAVELQPVADYATVDEAHPEWPQYNWGYDPLNQNVPEGSYATDARQPEVRIRELKLMVQALHKAGIRVILDVVYNHCYSIEGSNFQRTYPGAFFRTRKEEAGQQGSRAHDTFYNGSGCGNETASEHPLMRQFMVESVCYWAKEYHVDGFRFDLMGVHDVETMNLIRQALDKIDPSITMYGEPWSAGECGLEADRLAMKPALTRMPGIGAFGNEMRDAIRGAFDDDARPGWLAGKRGLAERIKLGLVGAVNHPQLRMEGVSYCDRAWALEPWQHVAYASCHDDLCLFDRLKASFPKADMQTLMRLDMLAQTPVLLGQGIPFLYAGEEALRSKQGVRNAYRSPDSVNLIDWSNLNRYPELFLYYRGLIQLRREHKAFRMGSAELVCRHLRFLEAPANVVAFRLDGAAVDDSWPAIYVVLNPNRRPARIRLPQGHYTVVCQDGQVNVQGLGTVKGGIIHAGPQQAIVLHT